MREDKGKTASSQKASGEITQEELLSDALQACMEEQLSFLPTDREIARMHTFSQKFEMAMDELCRTRGEMRKRELTRKEFVFGFHRIAACVLLMLVLGGVFVGGYLLSEHGLIGADTASTATAEIADEEAEAGVKENESSADQSMSTGESEEALEKKEFMGVMIPLATEQSLPSEAGEVKMLVSSPALDRESESFKVTIGNLSETTISYSTDVRLQVYLDGAWYVVPKKEDAVNDQDEAVVELEPGMAQDEEIRLADYDLDFEAEKYRAVTCVEGQLLGSEFWFEDLEEGLEEALENTLSDKE